MKHVYYLFDVQRVVISRKQRFLLYRSHKIKVIFYYNLEPRIARNRSRDSAIWIFYLVGFLRYFSRSKFCADFKNDNKTLINRNLHTEKSNFWKKSLFFGISN